jgi:hypothetical protein
MGWCYEFGPQIAEGCDHAMTAGEHSCMCTSCGVVCTGKFAGCGAVWARGAGDTIERPRRPRDSLLTLVAESADPIAQRHEVVVDGLVDRVADAAAAGRGAVEPGEPSVAVVEWLRDAFRDVHSELRARASSRDSHRALTSRTGEGADVDLAGVADDIVSRLEAILTARAVSPTDAPKGIDDLVADVRTAVADARDDRPPVEAAPSAGLGATADELRQTVAEVHALTDQLRAEMARLAAFRRALGESNPAVAALVDESADRAGRRYAERYGA